LERDAIPRADTVGAPPAGKVFGAFEQCGV